MGKLITCPSKNKMTKKEQKLEIQAKLNAAGLSLELETISAVYEAFVDMIGDALASGYSVGVPGIGRFETRYRLPKIFYCPTTQERVYLDDRYVPFLEMSPKLKKQVREGLDVSSTSDGEQASSARGQKRSADAPKRSGRGEGLYADNPAQKARDREAEIQMRKIRVKMEEKGLDPFDPNDVEEYKILYADDDEYSALMPTD